MCAPGGIHARGGDSAPTGEGEDCGGVGRRHGGFITAGCRRGGEL